MAEEDKIDRRHRESRSKGMSLYADSADYERRLSEVVCPLGLDSDIADEPAADDA
jgi:hypothetical protein